METPEWKNRSSESDFIRFFEGLDENYQKYLINEMKKKPPDQVKKSTKADSAGMDGGPISR